MSTLTNRPTLWRLGLIAVLVSAAVVGSPPLGAQTSGDPASAEELELEPIRCWWRTDETAVIVGEHFTVSLTCAVIETSRIRVVANRDQLDATALELSPFEVVGGLRHEDIRTGLWRYFQYEYTVRLLGNEFFGQDVDIPSTAITYTIVSGASEAEGREQTYVLPPLPMRIASLVPRKANDIRAGALETFASIEARRFRGTSELVAAAVSFGLAAVLLGFAIARTAVRYRGRVALTARPLAARAVLGSTLRAIRQLKSQVAREGWNRDCAARALAALRVAAAVALGRTIAETPGGPQTPIREGQLPLQSGVLRRRYALISASTGPNAEPTSTGTAHGAQDHPPLDQIRESLRAFTAARYSRQERLDGAALDAALDRGERAIRRLRVRQMWPGRIAAAIGRREGAAGALLWFR